MLDRIKGNSLLTNTGIYTITNLMNKAIPFLLLPILTRYLTPEDYGIVSMFTLMVSMTLPFIGLTVNGSITRKYYDKENDSISKYIFNCIIIVLINTILVGGVYYIFGDMISKITHIPERSLWIIVVIVISEVFINIMLALWQVRKKALRFGAFTNAKTLLNLGLSILFVVVLSLGWRGRIYGYLIAYALFGLAALFLLLRGGWITAVFDKRDIRRALAFGIPLIPHALSGTILSMTDRLFITNMVGIAETGVYTVGYQIGSIINLFALSFNSAFVPWLFERLKKNEAKTKVKIVKFTYLYFLGILVLAVIAGIAAPPLLRSFLGKAFSQSGIYVIWIAIGYAFQGMYLMVVNYIFYAQKTGSLAVVTFSTAIINVVMNYFFIKSYGATGAAVSTTIIYFIKFLFVWILSARVHKMPWGYFIKR